jgi:hypothetical protein
MRERLTFLLQRCPGCHKDFVDNVALIADGDRQLTEEQVKQTYDYLMKKHLRHVGD